MVNRKGYSYVLVKNNRLKIIVVYKSKCGFRVYVIKLRDCETFHIKTFEPDHHYPIVFHNRIVSLKYLAKKHLEELRENLNWNVKVVQKKLQRELGIKISLSKCYRA